MKAKISAIVGCALLFSFITMVILSVTNIDGALEDTSIWIFFIIGSFTATIGSVVGTSE